MDSTSLELLIGIVLPPVIDVINRFITNQSWRYVASIVVCLIVGFLLNIQNLNLADFLQSSAVVFAAAQTVYAKYYKESKLQETIRG